MIKKSHVTTHIFTVSVREGRCNSVPAKCMGSDADVTKSAKMMKKSHVTAHIFTVSVREGRCNSVPAKCMGPNADVTKICEHDKEITCHGSYIYCFSKGRKM